MVEVPSSLGNRAFYMTKTAHKLLIGARQSGFWIHLGMSG